MSLAEGLGDANLAEASLPDYLYPPANVPGAWHSVHDSGRQKMNLISRIPTQHVEKRSLACTFPLTLLIPTQRTALKLNRHL